MKDTIYVCIRTSDDVPVRESVKFNTGVLKAGEVLAVERWQGELMIKRGVVEEVQAEAPAPEHPRTKKKRASKKKPVEPLAPPPPEVSEASPAADFMK